MNRYKGKAARWQQQDKEEQRMNKTEFIKVRCTSEEKKRIKSKAESAGRKFSDYCREILLSRPSKRRHRIFHIALREELVLKI